jgi:hypothetical protein
VFPIVEHYIEHLTFPKASTGRLIGEGIKTGAGKLAASGRKFVQKIDDKVAKVTKKIDDKVAKVTKKIDDVAETGKVDDIVADVSKIDDAAKKIDDVAETGKVAKEIDLPPAYSKIDDAAKKIDDIGAKVPKDPSEFSKFLSKNKGRIIGATTLGAIATTAAVLSEKINKTDYTITSIKKDSTDPSKTIITYKPEDMFTKRDSIMISSSNSNPHIDGEYSIQPLRGGSLRIDKTISKEGNYGIMKCYTSVSNQTTQIINDITKPVTTTVGGVAGGVISDVLGDIIPSTLQSFGFGGLGNVPVFSWIACVLCIIILSMLLMLVIVI